MSVSTSTLTVEPVTATIGAEVSGIDLAEELTDETIGEIRAALLEWKVLFFRDQHRLDRAGHIAFGRRFGDLEIHPGTPLDQPDREVLILGSGGRKKAPAVWHSDVTWRPEPSLGSILRAVELPPVGGDTLWADMAAAYDRLDDATKAQIDGLVARHDYTSAFGQLVTSEEVRAQMRIDHPTAEHPVVRTHPETGRKAIYVNAAFTIGIKGMADDEAGSLLSRLYLTASSPDVQCRLRWRPGTLAFWDNRSAQHIASNDFLPARRVMERVTIVGDRPV
jgi:taurine dioxygenase